MSHGTQPLNGITHDMVSRPCILFRAIGIGVLIGVIQIFTHIIPQNKRRGIHMAERFSLVIFDIRKYRLVNPTY